MITYFFVRSTVLPQYRAREVQVPTSAGAPRATAWARLWQPVSPSSWPAPSTSRTVMSAGPGRGAIARQDHRRDGLIRYHRAARPVRREQDELIVPVVRMPGVSGGVPVKPGRSVGDATAVVTAWSPDRPETMDERRFEPDSRKAKTLIGREKWTPPDTSGKQAIELENRRAQAHRGSNPRPSA
jgi:hypothetical protein